MHAADPVVVIGAGFVGLCSALHVQREGRAVVVIDPGDPQRAASYGNAGSLAVDEVVPIAGPHVLRSLPLWLTDPLGPLAVRLSYLPRFIDRASSAGNVVYGFGHGHMGLSWGATTGRLVAGLIGEPSTNFDLSPFRAGRFA